MLLQGPAQIAVGDSGPAQPFRSARSCAPAGPGAHFAGEQGAITALEAGRFGHVGASRSAGCLLISSHLCDVVSCVMLTGWVVMLAL